MEGCNRRPKPEMPVVRRNLEPHEISVYQWLRGKSLNDWTARQRSSHRAKFADLTLFVIGKPQKASEPSLRTEN